MKNKFLIIALLFLTIHSFQLHGQDRIAELEKKLMEYAEMHPNLLDTISEISVSDISIQDFILSDAYISGVNAHVDPSVNVIINQNFTNIRFVDVLLFLCKTYHLDISVVSNILSITRYKEPVVEKVAVEKKINVSYDQIKGEISLDLRNDSLYKVARAITKETGINVTLAQGIDSRLVSSYIINKPFESAIENFAYTNNLILSKTSDDFYLLEPMEETKSTSTSSKRRSKTSKGNGFSPLSGDELQIEASNINNITVNAFEAPVKDIIASIATQLNLNYIFLSEMKGTVSLNVKGISFDELMYHLLSGSTITYIYDNGIYVIGELNIKEIGTCEVIKLQYRTVENLMEFVPPQFTDGLTINEFLDLNSLIVSGPQVKINELKKVINKLDKTVPVILIEVIIIDLSNSTTISTGVDAGLGESNITQTNGTLFPAVDVNLSTHAINELINSFNGFGWFKIGKVTPEFYMSIKALEDQGIVKIRSTPKLSTLNGHEATLTSGQQKYYYEEKSNVSLTQSVHEQNYKTWKSVTADLQITIKPIVSGDEHITLDLSVVQSDFTPREYPDAPPGSVNRDFKSMIRVKNQEMVLLGGLETLKNSNSGTSLPLLGRIPVLKWIFSSRTKEDKTSKLNIFIKPTVIY